MTRKLAASVAIVTGASSGIGRATALALAEQGASVAVIARRHDRLDSLVSEIRESGGTAHAVPADITDRDAAHEAVARTVEHFGGLDILVNNAGVMFRARFADADLDDLERMISVNQKSLLYLTKAALPHLHAAATHSPRRVADIVNISSHAAHSAWADLATYSMTKFGVNGFTEALRQEVTQSHVRVGVLEPGGVETELLSHNSAEVQAELARSRGTREVLRPEDIAEGVIYMVTRPRRTSISQLCIMPTEQP